MIEERFLKEVPERLSQLKLRADKAISQVSDAEFSVTLDDEANSIALIMKHVAGNMRSRWTDFLTSDGEKPNRRRDSEFEADGQDTRAAVTAAWHAGWDLTIRTIAALTPEDLQKHVQIRGESLSVVDAIHRQMMHYAEHVGQIVLLAKHYAGAEWQSLSIPKRRAR